MKPRAKRFLSYLVLLVVPLLVLAVFNYWNSVRLTHQMMSESVQESLNILAYDIDQNLRNEETELRRLASSDAVRQFFANARSAGEPTTAGSVERLDSANASQQANSSKGIFPAELRESVAGVLNRRSKLSMVLFFDENRLLLQVGRSNSPTDGIMLRAKDIPPQRLPPEALQAGEFTRIPNTTVLRFVTPISTNRTGAGAAIAGELNLEELLAESGATFSRDPTTLMSIVWDSEGKLLYHPNPSLRNKSIAELFPNTGLAAGDTSGIENVSSPTGEDYLIAYSPLPRLGITMAVVKNSSAVSSVVRTLGLTGIGIAILFAFAAAFLFESAVHRKTRGMERLTEGLTALAQGKVDQRVEFTSGDQAKPIAENLNVLTERLRSQIAREAEARQFESFFRLSAMLTHDLKNAIEALSLIVGNMERHFENEQFRADAMKSLTTATNKLRALVARLSRPVTSLSGEHKLPQQIDLVPVLKRAIKSTAEPMSDRHEIKTNLPPVLLVVTDEDRVEEVFENLLLNAFEAMPEKGGKVTIDARQSPEGQAIIEITDTGCGISATFIRHSLFHPFRTTKKNGIGLGLYTCREVIRASGGQIEVESQQGIGTTFRVVLPSST